MSGNEQIARGLRVIPAVIPALLACALGTPAWGAPPDAPGPATALIDASPGALAAVKALGPDVRFFTARGRPLRSLAEIRDPGVEVGSADLDLARGVMALLRAGGVEMPGGAFDVMTLASDNQLGSIFSRHKGLRLFIARARPGGAERSIANRGGGVPLAFRASGGERVGTPDPAAGQPAGTPAAPAAPAAAPASAAAEADLRTSFGPIRKVTRAASARQRTWDRASAKVTQKTARPGRAFVVVHIDCDFSAGLGKVAYLFGSGVILNPDFTQLVVLDGNRRHAPAAVHDEGPTLELAYDLPAGAKNLRLQDGDRTFPLDDRLATAP